MIWLLLLVGGGALALAIVRANARREVDKNRVMSNDSAAYTSSGDGGSVFWSSGADGAAGSAGDSGTSCEASGSDSSSSDCGGGDSGGSSD